VTGCPPIDEAVWTCVEALATTRGLDVDRTEAPLIERVAWGLHASRGLGSPRAEWSSMGDEARAELFLAAYGAMSAYRRYLPEFPSDADPSQRLIERAYEAAHEFADDPRQALVCVIEHLEPRVK
jgi:hypothetical protein